VPRVRRCSPICPGTRSRRRLAPVPRILADETRARAELPRTHGQIRETTSRSVRNDVDHAHLDTLSWSTGGGGRQDLRFDVSRLLSAEGPGVRSEFLRNAVPAQHVDRLGPISQARVEYGDQRATPAQRRKWIIPSERRLADLLDCDRAPKAERASA